MLVTQLYPLCLDHHVVTAISLLINEHYQTSNRHRHTKSMHASLQKWMSREEANLHGLELSSVRVDCVQISGFS